MYDKAAPPNMQKSDDVIKNPKKKQINPKARSKSSTIALESKALSLQGRFSV